MVIQKATTNGVELRAGRLALELGAILLFSAGAPGDGAIELSAADLDALRRLVNDPRLDALLGGPGPAAVTVSTVEGGATLATRGDVDVMLDADGAQLHTLACILFLDHAELRDLAACLSHPEVAARLAATLREKLAHAA